VAAEPRLAAPQVPKAKAPEALRPWRFLGASYLFGPTTIRQCRAMNLQ